MKESEIRICGHGGGYPTVKNMQTYLEGRYRSIAPNGKHKGVVCVKRLKKLDDKGRKKFHDTYSTILGRNVYSQTLRGYVYSTYKGKYYSDCSSSGMATFSKIGYYEGALLNTAGIYYSSCFENVPVKIVSGHIANPEILKVGDALLFVGSDPSRPLQIGHVEYVYEMPKGTKNNESKPETKSKVTFKAGKVYTTIVDELNVREEPNGRIKNKRELTDSGKKNSNSKGQLNKNTAVTCQAVKTLGKDIWIRIPSGWICAYNNGKKYVK